MCLHEAQPQGPILVQVHCEGSFGPKPAGQLTVAGHKLGGLVDDGAAEASKEEPVPPVCTLLPTISCFTSLHVGASCTVATASKPSSKHWRHGTSGGSAILSLCAPSPRGALPQRSPNIRGRQDDAHSPRMRELGRWQGGLGLPHGHEGPRGSTVFHRAATSLPAKAKLLQSPQSIDRGTKQSVSCPNSMLFLADRTTSLLQRDGGCPPRSTPAACCSST